LKRAKQAIIRYQRRYFFLDPNLTSLKKHIFFELLDRAGRVFLLVRYSDDVLIGERGFLPEEKEKGIVLVFNQKMNFAWNEHGISATLGFGTKTERCFIPPESIISVFSPDLNAQFSVSPAAQEAGQRKRVVRKVHSISKQKVIKVDFSKKS
jgi:hypothetical protein